METSNACPVCTMNDVLEADEGFECVTCGHEWPKPSANSGEPSLPIVKDSNGNLLSTGDSVTVIKDLKVKGSSTTLKAGTKIKRIRLVDGDHEVDCKVDGMGVMLKAKFLKKA